MEPEYFSVRRAGLTRSEQHLADEFHNSHLQDSAPINQLVSMTA